MRRIDCRGYFSAVPGLMDRFDTERNHRLENNFINAWMTIDEANDPEHFVRLMDRQRKGKDDAPDQYDTVIEMLGISEGQRILDVGCGTGGAVRALAGQVGASGSVVGVDSSLTMIGEAIRRSSSLRRAVEFHYGDVYQLSFADH